MLLRVLQTHWRTFLAELHAQGDGALAAKLPGIAKLAPKLREAHEATAATLTLGPLPRRHRAVDRGAVLRVPRVLARGRRVPRRIGAAL